MATKKQLATQRKADWNRAIAEGRIVRVGDPGSSLLVHREYPTAAEACAAILSLSGDGLKAEIVDPALAVRS